MAAAVSIEMATGASVMLEVYYENKGRRSADEIARFSGKRVRVTGTLHARTPSQNVEGQVMQTMIGPYVGELEALDEVAGAPLPTH
jgi:hypothetical protein